MNRIPTNRASVARLLMPLFIVGVVTACTAGASSTTSPAAAPSSGSASAAAPSPAATPSPTATPAATASPKPASPAPSASAPSSGDVTIHTAKSASLGTYLTAPDGRTLYTLSSDPTDKSTCAGACATAWPPLLIAANGKITQPSTVMGTFGIIKRADGTHQVTFDGHPLYTFIKDTASGQTNGEGVVAFGGKWLVAKAA